MKKTFQFTILIMAALVIGFSGCSDNEEPTPPLTQGNPESATIAHNTTHTFTLAAATGGAGTIAHQWQSSADNATWANISGATSPNFTTPALTESTYFRRQAMANGETIFSASARITVTVALTQGNPESVTINTGETHTFTLAAAIGGLGDITHQWQSSADNASWTNISGATSPNFTTPALTKNTYFRRQATAGNETITSSSALITINFPVTEVTLNTDAITLLVGETHTLTATVLPENATNPIVTWISSNPNIASVADGIITPHLAGTTTITVTTDDGAHTANATVTVIDGLDGVRISNIIWATRNVAAPGTFAENPQDAGMFYQWNRRTGWASTGYEWPNYSSMPGWDNTIPIGTAWYAENDPCPPGWRVPTQQELHSLNNAGSTWVINWNDTGVNGRVFGSVPNQIFLSAAGGRCANGALSDVGSIGYYWSSFPSTFFANNAILLWLQQGSSSAVNANRAYGLLVRCVAE